ncbi:2-octaprenyl-6-methoxyphenyl hydroxylase [Corallincola platygyrae]|uniref:2-octaprenyl-6-methoxyphenyl hydroxylase n=1 Tax=Corallincola platygyrae TaxID=1193278 RepID=A0ABW4XRL9_9GAMM
MSDAASQYDLIIVGAGMAGATLALGLLDECPQIRLALIDGAAPESDNHPSFDNRALALSANTIEQLKAWSLWGALAADAAPIQHIQVSDRGHFGVTNLHASEQSSSSQGQPSFGHVLEVSSVGAVVTQRLQQQSQVDLFAPAKVSELKQQQDQVQLQLDNGKQLTAKLLVVADGGRSHTRELLGIGVRRSAYEQSAVIANLEFEQPHNGWAYERFTDTGPMALLPMSGGRTSLVWCLGHEQAKQIAELDDQAFIKALQPVAGYRLGRLKKAGVRDVYPLQLMQSEQLIHHRAVVLGNAAHALHPIAGQGFNLAMRDIQTLVRVVADSWREQTDIGLHGVLKHYRDGREADINQVVNFTDGLCRLFSNNARSMALLRSTGLAALQWLPSLQAPLTQLGMGLGRVEPLSGNTL